MKAIQMFFEMLTQYQIIKNELKHKFEKYRVEMRIYYERQMKELRDSQKEHSFKKIKRHE